MSEAKKAGFLSGLTHALVLVSELDYARETGIIANVDLCFGNNDDRITGICYVCEPDGTKTWKVPHYQVSEGSKTYMPVFSGNLLKRLCEVGARALDRIRKDLGKPEYGKQYRVGDTTEEVTE